MAAGAEHVGHVYNLEDGSLLGRLVGHSKQITCVDWMETPEGTFLLTGSEDQTLKQWQRTDVIPGDVFETFAEGSWKPESSFGIAFNKEGNLYGIDNDSHLFRCTDILGSGLTAPFLENYADGPSMGDKTCASLSPDGQTWALCSYGYESQTISVEDGHELHEFSMEVCHNTLLWDPTGKPRFFASGHGDRAVIWNAETTELDCTFDISEWVFYGSWSADGRFIAVAHNASTDVSIHHLGTVSKVLISRCLT